MVKMIGKGYTSGRVPHVGAAAIRVTVLDEDSKPGDVVTLGHGHTAGGRIASIDRRRTRRPHPRQVYGRLTSLR